jgi:hypothetical protein
MREFILVDVYGDTIKVTWNPDAVQLRFEDRPETLQSPKSLSFDGKEALQLIAFITSL